MAADLIKIYILFFTFRYQRERWKKGGFCGPPFSVVYQTVHYSEVFLYDFSLMKMYLNERGISG